MSSGYFYAVYIGNMVLCGMIGSYTRVRIAAVSISTESIDSPNRWTRRTTRYLIFQFWLLVVTGVSVLYGNPLVKALIELSVPMSLVPGIYLLSCVPLTLLCYRWDLRWVRRADARKIAGREALRKKWGGRRWI